MTIGKVPETIAPSTVPAMLALLSAPTRQKSKRHEHPASRPSKTLPWRPMAQKTIKTNSAPHTHTHLHAPATRQATGSIFPAPNRQLMIHAVGMLSAMRRYSGLQAMVVKMIRVRRVCPSCSVYVEQRAAGVACPQQRRVEKIQKSVECSPM